MPHPPSVTPTLKIGSRIGRQRARPATDGPVISRQSSDSDRPDIDDDDNNFNTPHPESVGKLRGGRSEVGSDATPIATKPRLLPARATVHQIEQQLQQQPQQEWGPGVMETIPLQAKTRQLQPPLAPQSGDEGIMVERPGIDNMEACEKIIKGITSERDGRRRRLSMTSPVLAAEQGVEPGDSGQVGESVGAISYRECYALHSVSINDQTTAKVTA